jgi:hypothetical protein
MFSTAAISIMDIIPLANLSWQQQVLPGDAVERLPIDRRGIHLPNRGLLFDILCDAGFSKREMCIYCFCQWARINGELYFGKKGIFF